MPLVAVDTNIVDRLVDAVTSSEAIDASEAMEARPALPNDIPVPLQRELAAAYWLRTLSPAWSSVLYTFCDLLLDEVASTASHRRRFELLDLAMAMRSYHPPEYRVSSPELTPNIHPLIAAGIKEADATHLALAAGLDADVFLTDDRGILKVVRRNRELVTLDVLRPSEFLVRSVRAGAPWPCSVDWPWLSLPGASP